MAIFQQIQGGNRSFVELNWLNLLVASDFKSVEAYGGIDHRQGWLKQVSAV